MTDLSFLPKSASTTKARQQAESPSAKGAKTPRAAVADRCVEMKGEGQCGQTMSCAHHSIALGSRVGNKKNARTENDRWERGLGVFRLLHHSPGLPVSPALLSSPPDVRNTRDSRNGTGTGKHTAGDGRPGNRERGGDCVCATRPPPSSPPPTPASLSFASPPRPQPLR